MNQIQEVQRINDRELELGLTGTSGSWHTQYEHSAYVFCGGLPYQLNEGDLVVVFSQFGEVVDLNLVRDTEDGKSKGFAFLAFENQASTVLAIDNMNGATILGRTIRVDHADRYRRPKDGGGDDDDEKKHAGKAYDARRRRIWDFEAYEAWDAMHGGGGTAAAAATTMVQSSSSSSSSSSRASGEVPVDLSYATAASLPAGDKNAQRILDVMAKRKAARRLKQRAGVGDSSWSSPSSASSSSRQQPRPERPHDRPDKHTMKQMKKNEKKKKKKKKQKKTNKEKKQKKKHKSKTSDKKTKKRSKRDGESDSDHAGEPLAKRAKRH
jgi:RNA recognition motif-containing protein